MPSASERRLINWFTHSVYNTSREPRIIDVQADRKQEAPDSICKLEDGRIVSLELTSCGPPKGTRDRHIPTCPKDLNPLIGTLNKKFLNDYRISEADEVWLLVHLRYTLSRELVEETVGNLVIPPRFNRVYLEWPLPQKTDRTSINVLELPSHEFWIPDTPRPKRNKKLKIPEYLLR